MSRVTARIPHESWVTIPSPLESLTEESQKALWGVIAEKKKRSLCKERNEDNLLFSEHSSFSIHENLASKWWEGLLWFRRKEDTLSENHVPDIDGIKEKPRRRVRDEYQLRKDLRKIFHLEYLRKLICQMKSENLTTVKLGDVVFAECDNLKRIYWPLGKETEGPPEKDKLS
ncbi:hypothetical protein NPIL_470841 [Nephila pilipes]|uniref:DUF5641 domain-containing protein n=1 Tax=Nephila pilipes TaxID=299642 RepID=A0A8X6UMC1_NEPPI|nr:hypothetical protein NPIL_470841 [Nephila pilipes]